METKVSLNYIPNPKQKIAHEAVERNKLYGGAVGGGKTYWLCIEAFFHAIKYPGSRVCMVRHHLSTFKNSTLITLLKLIPDAVKNHPKWGHNQQDGKITLPNGSVIAYGGVGTPEEVQKIGSTEFSLICLDEASEIALEPFLFLSSRLRWKLPDGTIPPYNMLLASNPAHGWLKEKFIDSPGEGFIFIQALPSDNMENLPEGYIDNLRKIYPEEWIQKYLEGDWNALSGDNVVIPHDWVMAAVDREITIEDKPLIGVDPAGTGGDENVIIYMRGGCVMDVSANRQQDPMISCGRISRMFYDKNCKRVMVETDGMGEIFLSRLREMGIKASGFRSGSKSSKPDKYYNLKTEAWFYVRGLFEDGKVSIPKDDKLINQLCATTYEIRDSGGKLKITSKKDMKGKMGGSPDRADALIVALWCGKFMRDSSRDFTRGNSSRGNQMHHLLNGSSKDGYGWDKVGL